MYRIGKFLLQKSSLNWLNSIRNKSIISSNGIIKPVLEDISIVETSIPNFIWERTYQFSNQIALECSITGRHYTYNDLYKKSRNFSNALRLNLKLKTGDVIAILLQNTPEYAICLLGALQAGLIVTTINPTYTEYEISRQLLDSNSKCLITVPELLENSSNAIKDLKCSVHIISIGKGNQNKVINFFDLCEIQYDQLPDISNGIDKDVAVLPYSSGTTGLPKGVQLSHRNVVANLCQLLHPKNDFLKLSLEKQEILPCILPMFHIYGLVVVMLAPLTSGNKLITLPKFIPEQFINLLTKHRPNLLFLVPPIIQFLTNNQRITKEMLENVRYVTNGAAPLGINESQKFLEKFDNIRLSQGYGMTEASPVITLSPSWEDNLVMGSIGVPIANTECKVINLETNETCVANQQGELVIRGPQVMLGYHNNKEATDEVLDNDGWLKTGDVVYFDQDGNFFIADRIKELIKVKGFQVAPAELEDILCSHKMVSDAAVIGIPNEKFGEIPKAFVVKRNGFNVSENELKEFVNSKVAPHKQLEGGIVFIDSIPKSSAGKILRRDLKNM